MANKILVYIAMIHSSKIKINFVMYKFEAKLNSSNCAQQVVCLLDAVSDEFFHNLLFRIVPDYLPQFISFWRNFNRLPDTR
jgi:hypothetical protein